MGTNKHATSGVTGQKMGMHGRRMVSVAAGDHQVEHKFWFADIGKVCIVDLDLPACWNASIDVACSTLIIGQTTVTLHTAAKKKQTVRRTHQHQVGNADTACAE